MALQTRMTLWLDIRNRSQAEMISKFGFVIEAVGMFEEELAQLRRENTPKGQTLMADLEPLLNASE